jgi:hypothetical protein
MAIKRNSRLISKAMAILIALILIGYCQQNAAQAAVAPAIQRQQKPAGHLARECNKRS